LSLFRLEQGRILPVERLQVIGNEKLNFHVANDGKIDLLEVELNTTGASNDRYSPMAAWDFTMTRAALAEKLRPLAGNLGEIRDIQPAKLGESGRVVRIRVILSLRDTLFAISRTLDPDGSIGRFTFHGHGWGHGVGLCQVGAFGMARAGRSFEEILKTYYTGVDIRKAY
jgi:stage II sporulation protein D